MKKVKKYPTISATLAPIALLIFVLTSCNTRTSSQIGEHEFNNELVGESSPYLLQHAHNPVDWFPWGDKALEKAKKEDKLLIISVGYSACHWCHVMEHESFEDTLVAKTINEHYVSIKVDREERPDIDDVYMTACQLASERGGCGWPLNAIALPTGEPIWAGTYFPKKEWINVLQYFIDTKKNKPEELQKYAAQLTEGVNQQDDLPNFSGSADFSPKMMVALSDEILKSVDMQEGGRKGAPKFPLPNQFEFLLQQSFYTGNDEYLDAVNVSLEKMALGGIYDQIGGGFARYATDAKWLVPHFEKMLYDNAQLLSLYSHAFQTTQNPLYKKVVYETIEFASRELSHPDGAFYASLDADSEGEEGLFYIWKKKEIDAVLNEEEADLIHKYYNVSGVGNWEKGENILHRKMTDEKFISKHNLTKEQFEKTLKEANKKLFTERAKRIRPGLDDKVLASWNGLMIKGLLDAYSAFAEPKFLDLAKKNLAFLEKEMIKSDGRIDRNFKDGKSSINAFLDDYAFTIQAMIEMYQATFDEAWLDKASKIATYAVEHFKDPETGLFFYTSNIDPPLVARKKVIADNVIPGSNSAMATALFQLGTLTYNKIFIDYSETMLGTVSSTLLTSKSPGYYSNWSMLYNDVSRSPYEVAVIGENYEQLRKEMQQKFLPQVLYLGGKNEGKMELLREKLQDGRTMIYVCQNKACKLPVTESKKAIGQILGNTLK